MCVYSVCFLWKWIRYYNVTYAEQLMILLSLNNKTSLWFSFDILLHRVLLYHFRTSRENSSIVTFVTDIKYRQYVQYVANKSRDPVEVDRRMTLLHRLLHIRGMLKCKIGSLSYITHKARLLPLNVKQYSVVLNLQISNINVHSIL